MYKKAGGVFYGFFFLHSCLPSLCGRKMRPIQSGNCYMMMPAETGMYMQMAG